jgi:hypothetical protein
VYLGGAGSDASAGGLRVENTHPFEQEGRVSPTTATTALSSRSTRATATNARWVRGDTEPERFVALTTKEIVEEAGGSVEEGSTTAVCWIARELPSTSSTS